MARLVRTRDPSPRQLAELHAFVVAAFGGDFSPEDWEHCLGGWHVIAYDGDLPVSHAAVVPRTIWVGDEPFRAGYVEGVATRVGRQREGLGGLVMTDASDVVRRDFELGVLSTELGEFYRRLGWESWQGPTFVRDGSRLLRTQDEDDGIMVLRTGPSQHIDLSAPISCERRSGDDW